MARAKKTAADLLGPKKDVAASYNERKKFEGKQYTGMKIGRSHKWYYDKGTWKERKIAPDEWQIHYEVIKRRAGRAPEGSGVPVDTEYKWYILAEQHVKKLNANDYTTDMQGMKFKIAHKRAGSEKWSASEKAQKKRLVKFLQKMIEELQTEEEVEERKMTMEQKAEKASNGSVPKTSKKLAPAKD